MEGCYGLIYTYCVCVWGGCVWEVVCVWGDVCGRWYVCVGGWGGGMCGVFGALSCLPYI